MQAQGQHRSILQLTLTLIVLGESASLLLPSGPARVYEHTTISNSKSSDAESLMEELLEDYQKHLRPNFGGDPINVRISSYILDLYDINEQNHEFTVNMYLRQFWQDPRLAFDRNEINASEFKIDGDHVKSIWTPDLFILNERKSRVHDLTMKNEFATIDPDGNIILSNRFTVTASCKMSLGWFPFDRHTCSLQIESYGHTAADFTFNWKLDADGSKKGSLGISKEVSSIRFDVKAFKNRDEMSITVGNKTYNRLTMEFFLVRASSKYVQDLYFPSIILTVIAFFTMHTGGSSETRLQICVLCMTAILILMNLSSSTLPNTSHQTALDFYIFNCAALIFNAVLVHFGLFHFERRQGHQVISMRYVQQGSSSGNNYDGKETLYDNGEHNGDRDTDFIPLGPPNYSCRFKLLLLKGCKQSRIMLPLVFVIFNIIYWIVVIIGSSGYPEDFLLLEKHE